MLKHGIWIPMNPLNKNQKPGDVNVKKPSFHLSALYSPLGFFSWADAVDLFISAKKSNDRAKWKVFTNTVLGESFSEDDKTIEGVWVATRREYYSSDPSVEVPAPVVALTCGVDVQRNRLECEVVGWGANEESWSIDYQVFHGDPDFPEVWRMLDIYIQKQWKHSSGKMIQIYGTAVDSGDNTKKVYQYCRAREAIRVFPIKGKEGWGEGYFKKPKKRNDDGVMLFIGMVDELKSKFYGQLSVPAPGPQYCHFPAKDNFGKEYFEQLTSEKVVYHRTRTGKRLSFELRKDGIRNEALDCRVYNLLMKEILGLTVEHLNSFSAKGYILGCKDGTQNPTQKVVRKAVINNPGI